MASWEAWSHAPSPPRERLITRGQGCTRRPGRVWGGGRPPHLLLRIPGQPCPGRGGVSRHPRHRQPRRPAHRVVDVGVVPAAGAQRADRGQGRHWRRVCASGSRWHIRTPDGEKLASRWKSEGVRGSLPTLPGKWSPERLGIVGGPDRYLTRPSQTISTCFDCDPAPQFHHDRQKLRFGSGFELGIGKQPWVKGCY